jgi:hypothetical protein
MVVFAYGNCWQEQVLRQNIFEQIATWIIHESADNAICTIMIWAWWTKAMQKKI